MCGKAVSGKRLVNQRPYQIRDGQAVFAGGHLQRGDPSRIEAKGYDRSAPVSLGQ